MERTYPLKYPITCFHYNTLSFLPLLHSRIHTHISGNIVNNNDELQWTNIRLYKNIPVTLYSRKGCKRVDVGCVWEASWRRGQTATYWPKVLLAIAALLSRPWVTEGRKSSVCKLILTLASCPQLTPTATGTRTDCIKLSVAPGYIIVLRPPASRGRTHLHRIQPRPQVKVIFGYLRPDAPVSLFSRLFTQVHLLIDGSVEGQYVTPFLFFASII